MRAYRGVSLRSAVRADLPMILTLFGDVDRSHLWGHRRVCDEEQLLESWRFWSRERMNSAFVVLKHAKPIGLVFDYERCLEDGHSKVAAMLLDGASGRGDGVIALTLFAEWLFSTVPLRKLYLDVFAFNAQVVRMLHKLGVQEEMRRVEHRYWNGRYWDQVGFAFYRQNLPHLLQRIVRPLRARRPRSRADRPPAAAAATHESTSISQSDPYRSHDIAFSSLLPGA